MTMDRAKRGQSFRIVDIPDDLIRTQAIRFGITEGALVTCEEIIPAGPVVLRKNNQLLAMGRGLARRITIELA